MSPSRPIAATASRLITICDTFSIRGLRSASAALPRTRPRDVAAAAQLAGMVEEVAAPRISRRLRKLMSLRGLLTGEALTLPYFRDRRLASTVRRWLRDDPPDAIFVYSSSMAEYAPPRRPAAGRHGRSSSPSWTRTSGASMPGSGVV